MNARLSLGAFLAAAALTGIGAAPADTPGNLRAPPPPITGEDQAVADRVAAYLDGLGQVQGRFTQTDPRGNVTHGRFWLSRPGKARFEYDAPSSQLVVSNGRTVHVYDPRLKSFDSYPLARTPLALFLARHVSLSDRVMVTGVEPRPGGFAISLRDGKREAQGRITLVFSDGPLTLREWTAVDAQGGRTSVRVSDLRRAGGLDPKLFVLENPTLPRRAM